MTKSLTVRPPRANLDLYRQIHRGLGNCESTFSWIFSKLIGRANGNADIVWLAIISLEARLDLLWALVKFETAIAPETKDELKGCIDEFESSSSLRNYYCHAV